VSSWEAAYIPGRLPGFVRPAPQSPLEHHERGGQLGEALRRNGRAVATDWCELLELAAELTTAELTEVVAPPTSDTIGP